MPEDVPHFGNCVGWPTYPILNSNGQGTLPGRAHLGGWALTTRLATFAFGAGLGLSALTVPASAETILDLALANDPSITEKQFRELLDPTLDVNVFSFAWGVSANGSHAVGEMLTNCPPGVDAGACTVAAVWTPSFGTSPNRDAGVALPSPSLLVPEPLIITRFYSQARAIDAAGLTIVGRAEYETQVIVTSLFTYDALAWERQPGQAWSDIDQVTELPSSGVYNAAGARGISDDGGHAVGWTGSNDPTSDQLTEVEASLWTKQGPAVWDDPIRLGSSSLFHDVSVANAVAVDEQGNRVVVGWSGCAAGVGACHDTLQPPTIIAQGSDNPRNLFNQAWTPNATVWTVNPAGDNVQIVALAPLTGATRSDATAISADANTIVGWSDRTRTTATDPFVEAVRWTSGATWSAAQGLGVFAFPTSLGSSPFDSQPLGSVAMAVSERGSAIVGYQSFGFVSEDPFHVFSLAFIWTEALGTGRYLGDVLREAGVSLGNWVLYTATGVRESEEFFVVIGDGNADGEVAGPAPAYIARLGRTPDSPSGITTPEEQIESFGEISAAALAVGSSVGATLAGLNDTAENHRCIRPENGPTGNWCFFTFGTANLFSGDGELDGNQFTGEVGIAHYFTPVTSIAASFGGGVIDSDLYLGGSYRANEVHFGGYVAHIPDLGFRAFFGGVWGDLTDIDLTRGYLNGLGLARSFGNTEGDAWGLLGRLGYGFSAGPATLVTPFVEVSFTEASFDGYSEAGGPFPTTFRGIDTNATTGRLGVLHEQDLSATLRVYLQAAWAHVLDSETPTVRGAVLNIFELTAHGHSGIDDWAEFMAGARSQVSERGVVSVTGRVATEFDDFFSMGGRVGYSHIF